MHGHDVGPQGAQRDAPPGNGTHTGYTTAVVARGLGTHASPSRRTPHTHRCSLEGACPLTIPAAAHQAPAKAISHEHTSEPQRRQLTSDMWRTPTPNLGADPSPPRNALRTSEATPGKSSDQPSPLQWSPSSASNIFPFEATQTRRSGLP